MILSEIVQAKSAEIQMMKASRRSLRKAISSSKGLAVIAEIKKASPSRGIIEKTLSPEDRLRRYIEGGAAAVSVVTEKNFSVAPLRRLKT